MNAESITNDRPPAVDVTCALIFSGGRVLISRRPLGGRRPGAWEFPGGKKEPGESLAQCLAREILEELGLEVEVLRPWVTVFHDEGAWGIRLHAYICRLGRAAGPMEAGRSAVFTPPEDLFAYDLLPPDRIIADSLKRIGKEPWS